MKSATILLKTDPQLKADAQKLAEKCGISLNAVLSRSLEVFVRDRSITFADDATAYLPNARTAKELKTQLRNVRSRKNVGPAFGTAKEAMMHLKKVCR